MAITIAAFARGGRPSGNPWLATESVLELNLASANALTEEVDPRRFLVAGVSR